jgi:hypothetical protein
VLGWGIVVVWLCGCGIYGGVLDGLDGLDGCCILTISHRSLAQSRYGIKLHVSFSTNTRDELGSMHGLRKGSRVPSRKAFRLQDGEGGAVRKPRWWVGS